MKTDLPEAEMSMAAIIMRDFTGGNARRGVERLKTLNDGIHAAIPEKMRVGRGITWVVERVSRLMAAQGLPDEKLQEVALDIYSYLTDDDMLIGVPIFLMAEIGERHPFESLRFFERTARAEHWVVREFAAGAFRKIIAPNKNAVHPWLQKMAQGTDPNVRRFASETLRPVTHNKWLYQEPEYSLRVLRLMFKETHPYPRTSVGNNLSDLSRHQAELIYALVQELMDSGDKNSQWIAYRACRNLVKKDPVRVMDLLRVEGYHYKDRNFLRRAPEVPGMHGIAES